MDVVIVAGGYATRLRPLTYTKPKAALPILGRPLIEWVLEGARRISTSITIVARYLADAFRGIEGVRVVVEDRPMGDAGYVGIMARRGELTGDYVVVIYGDVFTDADLRALVDEHRRSGARLTMLVAEVPAEEVRRYGVVGVDGDGWVRWFVEKPSGEAGSNLINAGVYVFDSDVLRRIPEPARSEVKFSKDVIPGLVREGGVRAVVHKGVWFDIGTPRDYLRANMVAVAKYCPTGCVEGDVYGEVVSPSYVGPGSSVGKDSVVGPGAVLVDGVSVGPMSMVRGSVVMRRAVLEGGNYVVDSIVGEGVYLSRWVRVDGGIVSDGVYVREGVRVGRGASIGPHREVSDDVRDGEILP